MCVFHAISLVSCFAILKLMTLERYLNLEWKLSMRQNQCFHLKKKLNQHANTLLNHHVPACFYSESIFLIFFFHYENFSSGKEFSQLSHCIRNMHWKKGSKQIHAQVGNMTSRVSTEFVSRATFLATFYSFPSRHLATADSTHALFTPRFRENERRERKRERDKEEKKKGRQAHSCASFAAGESLFAVCESLVAGPLSRWIRISRIDRARSPLSWEIYRPITSAVLSRDCLVENRDRFCIRGFEDLFYVIQGTNMICSHYPSSGNWIRLEI